MQAVSPKNLNRTGLLFLVASVALLALLPAASASASISNYVYSSNFGSLGSGGQSSVQSGMDIDQSTGDVYVADPGNYRIDKFDPSGNFIAAWGYGVSDGQEVPEVCNAPQPCQAGIPGAAPGQFMSPLTVIVDNSTGPSAGDVYVVDTSFQGPSLHEIIKFDSSGKYLYTIDGSDTPTGLFSDPSNQDPWDSTPGSKGAISVDAQGHLWFALGIRVMEFSNDVHNHYVGDSEWTFPGTGPDTPPDNAAFGIVANADGSKLLTYGWINDNATGAFLMNSDGSNKGPALVCDGRGAFDSGTGDFFLGSGTSGNESICELNDSGALVRPQFGSGDISNVSSIAVNRTDGRIYVLDSNRVVVFTPTVVPDAITDPATDVGHNSGTLHGHVAPDSRGGGDVTDCHFEYGTTASYGSSVPCDQTPPMSASTPVTAHLTGLTHDQTYHFRVDATNANGTSRGQDQTFKPSAVLGVTTLAPTNLGPISATLNGSFDPDGSDTHYYFQWGSTGLYGHSTAVAPGVDAGSGTGTETVSADITGLSHDQTYHYRLIASNGLGTTVSPDRTFTAGPPLIPAVSDTAISQVTDSSATASAQIEPGYGNSMVLFEYGPSTSYGDVSLTTDLTATDNLPRPVSASLTGLAPGVTYHYRAVAINFTGTGHGPDQTFTTPDVPNVSGLFVTGVSDTAATLAANLNPELSDTTYHFEYGLTTFYGNSTASISVPASGASRGITQSLANLAPATTYHFRLVATNSVGTSASDDQSFTTSPAPNVTPPPPVGCKKGYVLRGGKCVKRRRKLHKSPHRKTHHKRHQRGGQAK